MQRIVVWPCRIGYASKAERLAYLIMYRTAATLGQHFAQ
jgi:hypothetical protein